MTTTIPTEKLASNYVGGEWLRSDSADSFEITNPATSEPLATLALAGTQDVAKAVASAAAAFPAWRRTPPEERIQFLFAFKQLLEAHFSDIARTTTLENGKTLSESKAELRRGIENVEVACGIPTLMQGYNLEDVSGGIDEIMIRQPLGVVAAITPFNFPSMIPLWFLPYAIACGNTFILKPSERVPLTARKIFELLHETGLPRGVVNLVVGAKPAVDALLHHPDVRAISFVGSTPVAKYIYVEGAAHGKRVQCQGGAKNHVVIMPDADVEMAAKVVSDSAFGCAGQRCLAVSTAVMVGEAREKFSAAILDLASTLRVGNGLQEDVQMGPVISPASKTRIERSIASGIESGGQALLDGRDARVASGQLPAAHRVNRARIESRLGHHRDLRSGSHVGTSRGSGRCHRDHSEKSLRKRGVDLHHQRRCSAKVPLRSSHRQRRCEHRRRGADGVFSLQRLEG